MPNPKIPVLIAGAGPTGLNLALSLASRRLPFRLISSAKGPGEHSRAMVVQARTLEFYDQYGFADEVIAQGVRAERAHLRRGGEEQEILSFRFADFGGDLSPYPFALAYGQDHHERFLAEKLEQLGVHIEWETTLTTFTQSANAVLSTVTRADGQMEEIESDYICGCDGARSQVRQTLGIGFPGGTYQQRFYVADAKISTGFNEDLYFNLGEHILTLMLPVRTGGMQRLIGLVPPELSDREDLTFEDIRGEVERLLNVRVTDLNWFSTYRVHHRVAAQFRSGRAFLAGDAGHIHSPAGGQGMNTGIGDAVNLGWKLAQVIQGRASANLLDTYEPERIAFARLLVSTTDRAFTPMVAEGLKGEFTRRILAPLILGVATRVAAAREGIFKVVSQTRIHYPDSALSIGKAGDVHGGDRLPWTGAHGENNFLPLRSLDWQMHVYGEVTQETATACGTSQLPLHRFDWSKAAEDAGFQRDAAYLVRPDGYVAAALPHQEPEGLKTLISRFGMRFSSSPALYESAGVRE